MINFIVIMTLSIFALPLLAADKKRILADYRLVGVISQDRGTKKNAGIAVLKIGNRRNSRSYTLKTGQALPKNPRWILKSVSRNQVVLERDGIEAVVGYVFGDSDEGNEIANHVEEPPKRPATRNVKKGNLDEFDYLIEEYRRKLLKEGARPGPKSRRRFADAAEDVVEEDEINEAPAEVVDLRDDYRSEGMEEEANFVNYQKFDTYDDEGDEGLSEDEAEEREVDSD